MDTFTQASDPEFAKSEISDLESQTERKGAGYGESYEVV
jgi:hypothetical protein